LSIIYISLFHQKVALVLCRLSIGHVADRFLSLSSGAVLFSSLVDIVLVLYSTIFYRNDTISLGAELAIVYTYWLSFCVFNMSLVVGQAIMLNSLVSILSRMILATKPIIVCIVRFCRVYSSVSVCLSVRSHVYAAISDTTEYIIIMQ